MKIKLSRCLRYHTLLKNKVTDLLLRILSCCLFILLIAGCQKHYKVAYSYPGNNWQVQINYPKNIVFEYQIASNIDYIAKECSAPLLKVYFKLIDDQKVEVGSGVIKDGKAFGLVTKNEIERAIKIKNLNLDFDDFFKDAIYDIYMVCYDPFKKHAPISIGYFRVVEVDK